MPTWRVTIFDERDDKEPAREIAVDAETMEEAAEKAVDAMRPWEKIANVERAS